MREKDFAKLYERNYRRAFLFAKSYVHDDMAAEDIAAESLFRYWQVLKNSGEDVSEAMLVTILRNKAIDHLRSEMHKLKALESMEEAAMRDLEIRVSALEACDPHGLYVDEIRQIVRRTLNALPRQTREIFWLNRMGNLTVNEIAERRRISPKTVEYHITKTLKILRVALKDYLPLWLVWFCILSELAGFPPPPRIFSHDGGKQV